MNVLENNYNYPNILYLIGNGLDLHYELKTSYKDFIQYYTKKALFNCIKNGEYKDECIEIVINESYWRDRKHNNLEKFLESNKEDINLKSLSKLPPDSKNDFVFKQNNYPHHEPYYYFIPQNDFVDHILKDCDVKGWAGIEHSLYTFLRKAFDFAEEMSKEIRNGSPAKKYNHSHELVILYNKSINCLKKELVEYLKSQNAPNDDIIDPITTTKSFNFSQNSKLKKHFCFLNFNYTTHFSESYSKLKISNLKDNFHFHNINIHGSIYDDPQEIIFGIGDEQEEFLKIIESYYHNEWLETMKSYQYLRNLNYKLLLDFIDKGYFHIYVIGHSCSITDRTLLKMIFENKYCLSINVMHRGKESYINTCYNISRNFSDKIRMREVLQPYDPKLKF